MHRFAGFSKLAWDLADVTQTRASKSVERPSGKIVSVLQGRTSETVADTKDSNGTLSFRRA